MIHGSSLTHRGYGPHISARNGWVACEHGFAEQKDGTYAQAGWSGVAPHGTLSLRRLRSQRILYAEVFFLLAFLNGD